MIKGLTRSAGAGREQVRDEKWNLGSVKAVLRRILGSKANTEIDTSVAWQDNITNQALDEHGCTTRNPRSDGDTGAHCRTRFENIWIKGFAETEVANRTIDVVPIDRNVRSSEQVEPADAVGDQLAAMDRTRRMIKLVQGNLCGIQLLTEMAGIMSVG